MKMIIIIDMLIPELHKLFVSFVRLVKDLNLKLTVMEANTVLKLIASRVSTLMLELISVKIAFITANIAMDQTMTSALNAWKIEEIMIFQ